MMSTILRFGVLFALVFGLVWLGVIIWWQESHRVVTARDVVLWMGCLPLALIALWLFLRSGVRWLAIPSSAAAPAAVAREPGQAEQTAAHKERGLSLAVIASGWAGAAGDDADSAVQAVKAGSVEPKLDSAVRDGDGLPVLLARHAALDIESVEPWLRTAGPKLHADLKPRLQRCLALLDSALTPVLDSLAPCFPSSASDAEPSAPPTARALRIALLQPEQFDPPALQRLENLIGEKIRDAGWGAVSLRLTALTSESSLPLLRWLDEALLEVHRGGLDDVLLLVGVDSTCDEHTLNHYAMRDLFYAAKRPHGRVPGEAAAVLALAAASALPTELIPAGKLHRPVSGLRDKPIDARGKVSDSLLAELVGQSLLASRVDTGQCVAVIADAGRSATRVEELALTMTRLLPELDPVADRLDIAAALGDLGAARLLSLLVYAATLAAAEQRPVLVAGLADAKERFALSVTVEEVAPPSA